MTRRTLIFLAVLAAALAAVQPASAADGVQTTTLLGPSGQPVGGPWQGWMNRKGSVMAAR